MSPHSSVEYQVGQKSWSAIALCGLPFRCPISQARKTDKMNRDREGAATTKPA